MGTVKANDLSMTELLASDSELQIKDTMLGMGMLSINGLGAMVVEAAAWDGSEQRSIAEGTVVVSVVLQVHAPNRDRFGYRISVLLTCYP
jgi:hypothetical protein